MQRISSNLYVMEGGTRVGLDHGALLVRRPTGVKTRVPLESVESVFVIGGASITVEAIAQCVREGVRVASLTRNGRMRFSCAPATSGNVHLRIAQLRIADDAHASMRFARIIVLGKLRNSQRLMRRWRADVGSPMAESMDRSLDIVSQCLIRAAQAPTGDHLRGAEGEAARAYFKAMSQSLVRLGPPFTLERRSRRPPADPLNAAISFGYGIMTAELVGAADAVGLDPQIGFLHVPRSGRPSLALDVVEEFRSQVVDRFVVRSLNLRQLRLEHFVETPGGGWYLNEVGRKEYLRLFDEFRLAEVRHDLLDSKVPRWTLPTTQMAIMARAVRGDLPTYVPWQFG